MRVVHICHVPLPPEHPDYGRLYSYPGSWVVNLALAQKTHTDLQPILITQVPGASSDFEYEIQGIPVEFVKIPNRFRSLLLFERDRRILAARALNKSPDFIHAHGTEESCTLAAQTIRKPYVITAQGLYSQINSVMPPPLISRSRVIEFLERRSLARARHIIAKSDYVRDWIRKQYPHLEIHQIPNTFHPPLLDIPTSKSPGTNIVFVGTVSPRKGLHLVADALETIKKQGLGSNNFSKISLHVVGNAGDKAGDYENVLLNRLRDLLGDRLVLHGTLPLLNAVKVVASCGLLVAPSYEEMFGNQVIEALLVGTWPVVSSETAMAENVSRLGAGSIFKRGDANALLETLEPLIAKHEDWNSQNIRRKVCDWMGPSSIAVQHRELYERLL